jgi:hypothetical protein
MHRFRDIGNLVKGPFARCEKRICPSREKNEDVDAKRLSTKNKDVIEALNTASFLGTRTDFFVSQRFTSD